MKILWLWLICLNFKVISFKLNFGRPLIIDLNKKITSSLIASTLILPIFPAIAIDDSNKIISSNQFDYVATSSEEARVARKIKLIQSSEGLNDKSSSRGSSSDGDRYKASLKKEKEKVEAISSKSKNQRSKDLCEVLGRGC